MRGIGAVLSWQRGQWCSPSGTAWQTPEKDGRVGHALDCRSSALLRRDTLFSWQAWERVCLTLCLARRAGRT